MTVEHLLHRATAALTHTSTDSIDWEFRTCFKEMRVALTRFLVADRDLLIRTVALVAAGVKAKMPLATDQEVARLAVALARTIVAEVEQSGEGER